MLKVNNLMYVPLIAIMRKIKIKILIHALIKNVNVQNFMLENFAN